MTYVWNLSIIFLQFMQMIQHPVNGKTEEVITKLTNITQKLFAWFSDNQMKFNHTKCHFWF